MHRIVGEMLDHLAGDHQVEMACPGKEAIPLRIEMIHANRENSPSFVIGIVFLSIFPRGP